MAKTRNYLAAGLAALTLSFNSCSLKPISVTTTMTSFTPSPQFILNCDTLEEARKNPGLRQTYIDKLVSMSKKPSDVEVIYDLTGNETTNNEFATTQGRFNSKSCQYEGALIYFGKLSFDDRLLVESEQDILYFLNHEYHHVSQSRNGIGKIPSSEIQKARKDGKLELSVINYAFELGALHNDLKQSTLKRFKISPMNLQHQKCAYSWNFHKILNSIDGSSKFQQEFIFETLRQVNDMPPEDNFLITLFYFQ